MKSVVMICTTVGGMAQVTSNLRETDLFAKFRMHLIVTHEQGGVLKRVGIFLRALAEFASLLITARVSLVHAHVAAHGSFWRKSTFLSLARLFRRPTVLHLHGSEFRDFYEKECGAVRRRLIRHILEHASTVIVLSERLQTYIRSIAPAARVLTIHNFVDAKRIESEMARASAERSSKLILFLGDLGRRKGIYDLVRALPQVAEAIPDVQVIAGGKGELENVRRCARDAGVEDHLVLPGFVSGREKMRLLAEAAIYVLPSYNEGVPVSILEAMSAGLPIISTPVGGIPDVIRDGEEGFLVSPGSTDELARRIIQLLGSKELRDRMGKNARRRLQSEFTSEVAVAALTALYQAHGAHALPCSDSSVSAPIKDS